LVKKDEIAELMRSEPLNLPLVRAFANVAQQINRCSAMFGMSPIDRRRMKIETAAVGDDIDDWENED
jgi:phage terminase small subunit